MDLYYNEDFKMIRMIKIELKKAFLNKWFLVAVTFGCMIAILQIIQDVVPMVKYTSSCISRNLPPHTLYNKWLGINSTLWNTVFFIIFPLLASIPFADSFHTDLKSGYVKNILTRTSKKNYYFSKYIAVFFSAGTTVVIPLILNLYLTAMILPTITPSVSAGFYPILETATLSHIYYSKPALYIIIYLCIIFMVSGVLASTALAFSHFIKYRYVITLIPYLCYLLVSFESMFFSNASIKIDAWVNPCSNVPLDLRIVILEVIILVLGTLLVYWFTGKKK